MNLADTNLLYREPQLYDQLNDGGPSRGDLILRLIDTHGPPNASTLLDLGCGTGRDLADLADRAPHLTTIGVDLQPGMINYGRRARPRLDLRIGDLRTIRLGHPVDVITCLGNTIAYLHTDHDLNAAFDTITAHTHPGTLLIIQTLIGTPNSSPPRTTTNHLAGGPVQVTTSTEYNSDTHIATTHRHWAFPDGRHATDHIQRRALTPDELHTQLRQAGFQLHTLASDPINPMPAANSAIRFAVATTAR